MGSSNTQCCRALAGRDDEQLRTPPVALVMATAV